MKGASILRLTKGDAIAITMIVVVTAVVVGWVWIETGGYARLTAPTRWQIPETTVAFADPQRRFMVDEEGSVLSALTADFSSLVVVGLPDRVISHLPSSALSASEVESITTAAAADAPKESTTIVPLHQAPGADERVFVVFHLQGRSVGAYISSPKPIQDAGLIEMVARSLAEG